MRYLHGVLAAALLLAGAHPSHADVVGAVHDLALRTARAAGASPAAQCDTLAVADLAMFDAANAIERRFEPYRLNSPSPPPAGADPAAAALGAGCGALAVLHPREAETTRRACDVVMATLATGPQVAASLAFGDAAGRSIATARLREIAPVANTYRPRTSPGIYVPTSLPIGYEYTTMTPLMLRSSSQFRPPPPPALASATWARDYEESRSLGGRSSTGRSASQTATARFWASGGPQQQLDSMAIFRYRTDATPAEHARFLALVTAAMADTSIAIFDAKYAYDFWRPITAIRNGDTDGNDATERDAAWVPLLDTPPHPEYPCAHCAVTAALAVAVDAAIADGALPAPIMIQPATAADAVPPRQYASGADVMAEVANARVWGGMHFRTSTDAGVTLGRAIAQWMLETQLRPVTPAR